MSSDSTRRALRTGIDAILAVLASFAAVLVFPGLGDAIGVGSEDLLRGGVVVGALVLFFTKVRNALEDRGTIPAILKAPASDGANPVPDEAGAGEARFILLVVVGVVLAAILLALFDVLL